MKALHGCTIALLALILPLIFLWGCSNKVDIEPLCPKTGFIGRTDTITYFVPGRSAPDTNLGAGTAPGSTKDIVATATINGFSGECVFKDKDKNIVDIDLTLPFRARKGQAGADLKEKELSYFIGILSPTEEILQRQAFTTKITFDETGTGSSTEEHTIKIPLKSRADIGKYKVIIGFALTRDQLKYNEEQSK